MNDLKNEFGRGILAAWLTAKGDPRGAFLVTNSFDACKRSFAAAIIAFPGFLALTSFELANLPGADTWRYILVQMIAYGMGWAAFPIAALGVARQIGRVESWARYITVYNWASVIILGLTIPATLVLSSSAASQGVAGMVQFMLLVAILGYEWRLARLVLQATPLQAALLVAVDTLLSFAINGMAHHIAAVTPSLP
ncbi:MAG: hypothetical protein HQL43_10315 [Alphaproteobacteria bacterium]|nr:hypothetical protein [Alphaproteobacteria bacterium]